MSAHYEAGTVASATIGTTPDCRIFRFENYRGRSGWRNAFHEYFDTPNGHTHVNVTDIRPLVVLDLPDGAKGGWPVLISALSEARRRTGYDMTFSGLIDQIEAQTRPPKPETASAHDGCHDKGWDDVDGVRYCRNCGFSEDARFIKGGGGAA